jgi:signal transduction histidine kinase
VVQQIVESHGGRIEVEGVGPGKGARFDICWPAAPG